MINGIVVFKLVNIGSKSEGMRPFLYQGNGIFQPIWMPNDFSLEGNDLKPFDKKEVSIDGIIEEHGIFLIKSFEEIK